ncbi:hypothetical protein B0T10DRAFT_262201 [Thelonectria olida]|uniref:Uncharacterized protein n=1 Tax=Thelonectria olida TaxID=1576542 RepID=A0A9P8VQD6_9HYPO|nr:hypothetical protein B0T10DRAFT_262201 [Thelonectria olida]
MRTLCLPTGKKHQSSSTSARVVVAAAAAKVATSQFLAQITLRPNYLIILLLRSYSHFLTCFFFFSPSSLLPAPLPFTLLLVSYNFCAL